MTVVLWVSLALSVLGCTGWSASGNAADLSLARIVADEFGAELVTPFLANPCQSDHLNGTPTCQLSREGAPYLQLGGIVVSPTKLAFAGGLVAWRIEPKSYCAVSQPDRTGLTVSLPARGLSRASYGPLPLTRDEVELILGVPSYFAMSSIEINFDNTALYSLSSAGRSKLAAKARENCSAKKIEAGHQVVGLASGTIALRLRLPKPITKAQMAALSHGVATRLGHDMTVHSPLPTEVLVFSGRPVFFGIALKALNSRQPPL